MTYSKDNIVSFIIIILHLVGTVGTALPMTRELVVSLTPINLLITFGLLIYTHEGAKIRLISFIVVSFLIGFGVEVLGVATSWPFGEYSYGETLGLKVFDVPLLIGINWFILSYCFGMILSRFQINWMLRSMGAAVGMVMLDFFIEPVAIQLDYWTWATQSIPMSNYLGWLGTALIIQIFFSQLFNQSRSKQSVLTISCQAFYFIILQIFFKI